MERSPIQKRKKKKKGRKEKIVDRLTNIEILALLQNCSLSLAKIGSMSQISSILFLLHSTLSHNIGIDVYDFKSASLKNYITKNT